MWTFIKSAAESAGSSPMFTWRHGPNRVELSGITFLNAVSKAANFISDGLEINPEARVYVNLGNHWQSPVWCSAVLATGAVLSDAPATFNIVNLDEAMPLSNSIVVSRDPFGMPERDLPESAINASAEVRGFGDYFAPRTATSEETVLTTWGVNVKHAMITVAAMRDEWGIAEAEPIGIALPQNPHMAIEWHSLFGLLNRSPLVLLDSAFEAEQVQTQERIGRIIDLR